MTLDDDSPPANDEQQENQIDWRANYKQALSSDEISTDVLASLSNLANQPLEILRQFEGLCAAAGHGIALDSKGRQPGDNNRRPIQTSIIEWYSDGSIEVRNKQRCEYFPVIDLGTLPGLFAYIWNLKIGKKMVSEMQKVTDRTDPIHGISTKINLSEDAFYSDHPYRSTFEKLCLNDCRKERSGRSEYCSDECRKNLNEWINAQAKLAATGAHGRAIMAKMKR